MPQNVADLRRIELPGIATFAEQPGGLVALDITSPIATGRVFLHGGHVAAWQPAGHAPVLFMSAKSHFAPGKPIRGGVPLIFPWFGARTGDPQAAPHGFARSLTWEAESLDYTEDRGVSVAMRLTDSQQTQAVWPYAFIARFRVTFGAQLAMVLEIENRSAVAISFEEALHTYFTVGDVRNVSVTGLENAEFIDKVDGLSRKRLGTEPLVFGGETDRVFPNTTATCVLNDPGLKRRIVVEKTGSNSTVVWNPWIAKAKAMADFGDEEWPGMLCIESANVGDNALTLEPEGVHTLTTRVSVDASL